MYKPNPITEIFLKAGEILNNPEYLDSLINKLQNYSVTEELGDEEKYNTQKDLSILYAIVDYYAKLSHLSPLCLSNFQWYNVKYGDDIFAIHKEDMENGDVVYKCYNVIATEKDLPYCIDIKYVKERNLIDINDLTEGEIVNLREYIKSLNSSGFTFDFIRQLVDETLNNIKDGKRQDYYRYKR